jgi:hypothetical protein
MTARAQLRGGPQGMDRGGRAGTLAARAHVWLLVCTRTRWRTRLLLVRACAARHSVRVLLAGGVVPAGLLLGTPDETRARAAAAARPLPVCVAAARSAFGASQTGCAVGRVAPMCRCCRAVSQAAPAVHLDAYFSSAAACLWSWLCHTKAGWDSLAQGPETRAVLCFPRLAAGFARRS